MPDDQEDGARARFASSAFGDVGVDVAIMVGRVRSTIRELMEFETGQVLALDRGVDEPVELFVGDRLVARGALEELEPGSGRIGVRVTEVALDGRAEAAAT